MSYDAGKYDVAVIGAGHAGIEAALASARLGCRTVIFTINMDAVGNCPCNPSIGGTAKGHLVREVDALGGEMGKTADECTLQSRMLNLGKGPAVHSLRAQIDRNKYARVMKHKLEQCENLVMRQAEVIDIERDGENWLLTTRLGAVYTCRAVVLATGGVSYRGSGSTGEGHRMAAMLGHTVTPLTGSLVPLRADGCAELQGLSLRNVGLTVYENGKKIYTDFGELLFTHFGVSGPLVLSSSAHMRHFDKKSYRLELDLKPALDEQQLDKRLLSDFQKHANSDFCNALGELLPQKFIPAAVKRSGIPPHEKVHDLTREQRAALRTLLKHWSIDVLSPMPVENAIITSGGVKVGEIDPKTMASKKVPGLYFAGEIIDVDAYTGGFNLQIAWATGKTAGEAAAEYLTEQ